MVLARFLLLEIHQQKWYWVHLSGHLSESSGFFSVGFLVGDRGGGRSGIWCSWRSTRALARGERDGNRWKTWRFRGYFDEWDMNQGDYCYIVHVVGIVVIFNPCQILAISTMIVSNWYSWDCMLVLYSCQCFYFGSRTVTHYQQHVCCCSCCWVILILLWFQPKLNWRFGVGWNPREPRQG